MEPRVENIVKIIILTVFGLKIISPTVFEVFKHQLEYKVTINHNILQYPSLLSSPCTLKEELSSNC